MAPKGWVQDDKQLEFLEGKMDAFIQAQKTRKFDRFWTDVQREWFENWKEEGQEVVPAPEDAENHRREVKDQVEKRIKQLKNWFNNTSKSRRVPKTKSQFQFNKAKTTRLPQKEEYFASKHYKTHVAPLLQAEMGSDERGPAEKPHIQAIKRAMREAYANAPEHMRQEVLDDLAEMKKVKEAHKAQKEEENDSERTAEEYAGAIEELPNTLLNFFTEISRKTGWAFSLIGGGPDPVNGGRIRTLGHHCGRNNLGHTFKQAHPTYSDSFIVPYAEFLHQIYPSDICQQRSLLGDTDTVHSDTSASSPPTASLAGQKENMGADGEAPDVESSVASAEGLVGMPRGGHGVQVNETDVSSVNGTPTLATPTNAHMSLEAPATSNDVAIEEGNSSFSGGLTNNNLPANDYMQDMSGIFDFQQASEKTNLNLVETLDPALDPAMMSWTDGLTEDEMNALLSFDPAWQQIFANPSMEASDLDLSNHNAGFHAPETPIPSNSATNAILETVQPTVETDIDPVSEMSRGNPVDPSIPNSRRPLSNVSQNVTPEESGTGTVNLVPSAAPVVNDSATDSSAKNSSKRKREVEQTKENDENGDANGRSQRNRKPAASKEVVTLTDRALNNGDNVAAGSWLFYARDYLTDEGLGSEWNDCVTAWMTFESSLASTISSRSTEANYSPESSTWSRWLQTRHYQHVPEIPDPAQFAKEWVTWWAALQPKERKGASVESLPVPMSAIPPPGADIRSLRKGGPNGIVTVIIGLKWWGQSKHDVETWSCAVWDVQECLDTLVSAVQGNSDGPARKRQKKQ
ncbi:hypothetical protein F5887DRAFT_924833 [Amanita rubescens]|nr:hypothetical protein F5887DRAFT_924833 [Amanita rubescens]